MIYPRIDCLIVCGVLWWTVCPSSAQHPRSRERYPPESLPALISEENGLIGVGGETGYHIDEPSYQISPSAAAATMAHSEERQQQRPVAALRRTTRRRHPHRKPALFLGDYDVIEVIQNNTFSEYGAEDDSFVGFSAVKERFCAAECIRGLSGLCICPPPDPASATTTALSAAPADDRILTGNVSLVTSTSRPPTPSFSGNAGTRHTPHHHLQRTNSRNNIDQSRQKPGDSYFASLSSNDGGNGNNMASLEEEEGHPMHRRVKRGDDDDEEDQKLCKCRRCRKLFKRTLYCRVFPCYQKKCKSGEWRATDRESTPSSAH